MNKNDETQIASSRQLERLPVHGYPGVNEVGADALQDGEAAGALREHRHAAAAVHAQPLFTDAVAQGCADEDSQQACQAHRARLDG